MNLAQLFLQLGIAGALLYVVYRLGDKLIDNQAAGQKRQLAVHGRQRWLHLHLRGELMRALLFLALAACAHTMRPAAPLPLQYDGKAEARTAEENAIACPLAFTAS